MLHTVESQLTRSVPRPLAAGVNSLQEGDLLEAVYEDGIMKVQPSTGGANSVFAGIAISEIFDLDSVVEIETLEAPDAAADTRELKYVPIADTADVAGSALTVNSNAGKTITLSAESGDALTIIYRRVPSVIEARRIQGDRSPGTHVALAQRQVGVLEAGHIVFDNFNTAHDWQGANAAALRANLVIGAAGRLDLAAAAVAATDTRKVNGIVTRVPYSHDGLGGAGVMGLSFAL